MSDKLPDVTTHMQLREDGEHWRAQVNSGHRGIAVGTGRTELEAVRELAAILAGALQGESREVLHLQCVIDEAKSRLRRVFG